MVKDVRYSSPKIDLGEDRSESSFIGESQKMKSIFALIHRVSQVNTSVLIRGENGTGKELVARAIHYNSPRKNKKFVAVNCGAIPESLAESEFFGHEKGAFTGADQRKIGKFQFAEGGTLFLDEVGDISLPMQVKLLRVLQEKSFTPVGSNREIKSDVRIISATNKPIDKLIAEGKFREDLFYRLNVIQITLPPLRDRLEDMPHLVAYFVQKFNRIQGTRILGADEQCMRKLKEYSWPGNIRELENTIERAFVLETGSYLTKDSLPEHFLQNETEKSGTDSGPLGNYHNQKENFEREFILNALKQFGGRINQTAHHAGIPKNTLLRKIKKYGINPRQFGSVDEDWDE
jgi:transcriptional regulator with PAS, ATPase and Fis domain